MDSERTLADLPKMETPVVPAPKGPRWDFFLASFIASALSAFDAVDGSSKGM